MYKNLLSCLLVGKDIGLVALYSQDLIQNLIQHLSAVCLSQFAINRGNLQIWKSLWGVWTWVSLTALFLFTLFIVCSADDDLEHSPSWLSFIQEAQFNTRVNMCTGDCYRFMFTCFSAASVDSLQVLNWKKTWQNWKTWCRV